LSLLLSVFEFPLSSGNIPSFLFHWLWWWMICMFWFWKAVRWWWWDISGAVDKLCHHHPFIWQPTPTNHPVKLRTIRMFFFCICILICIRRKVGSCCCSFYWSRNAGDWCSIGAVALITMMVVVALAVIVVEERVWLPTEGFLCLSRGCCRRWRRYRHSIFVMLPLSLSHRRCCLCCRVVVVTVVVVVEHLCYLRCFRFSFSSLLLLSSLFSFFVFVIVSLSTPFRSVILRIRGVTTVII